MQPIATAIAKNTYFGHGLNVRYFDFESNRHLCTMSKHVFLADDKMANISLDVLAPF